MLDPIVKAIFKLLHRLASKLFCDFWNVSDYAEKLVDTLRSIVVCDSSTDRQSKFKISTAKINIFLISTVKVPTSVG